MYGARQYGSVEYGSKKKSTRQGSVVLNPIGFVNMRSRQQARSFELDNITQPKMRSTQQKYPLAMDDVRVI